MIEVVVGRGLHRRHGDPGCDPPPVSRGATFYKLLTATSRRPSSTSTRQVTDFLCESMVEAGEGREWRAGPARCEGEGSPPWLDCFAANPDLARFRPGGAAGRRRRGVAAAYRDFLERLLHVLREGPPQNAPARPPPAAEYGLVGGLAALVIEAVRKQGARPASGALPARSGRAGAGGPYLGREAAVKAATG